MRDRILRYALKELELFLSRGYVSPYEKAKIEKGTVEAIKYIEMIKDNQPLIKEQQKLLQKIIREKAAYIYPDIVPILEKLI